MLRYVTIAASTIAALVIVAFAALAILTLLGIWPNQVEDLTTHEISAELSDDFITHVIGGNRPATLILPPDHQGGPLPLVIGLHGYESHAWEFETYTQLTKRVTEDRIALLLPQGSEEPDGDKFWNATEWCCDLENTGIDDVTYFHELIEETAQFVPVGGVYVYGQSNGGFMSYRLACESLPNLVAVANLSGSSNANDAECEQAVPVSILHIHGTNDDVVLYDGRAGSPDDPGHAAARDVVREWAQRANCHGAPDTSAPPIDLDQSIEGAETTITKYVECEGNRSIELWTVDGAGHDPDIDHANDLSLRLIDWFLSQPTPQPSE